MIAPLILAALASIPRPQGPDPDVRETLQRFRQQCAAAPGGPACQQARILLERALYRDLQTLYLAGERLERPVLEVAARAGSPELAAFGLRRLADAPAAGDAALAAEGLDSAYPAVRLAAAELAGRLDDPGLKLRANRLSHGRAPKGTGLIAEEPPAAAALGAAAYPGARYRPSASGSGLAVYTTADAPEQALAFYAKGRKVLTAAELKGRKAAKPDAQAMQQQMMAALMAGQDPQKVVEELGRSEQARQTDWTKGIDGEAGISGAKYVVLAEAGGVPTRVLAVYRDQAYGATTLAFRFSPESAMAAAPRTRQDVEFLAALHELLNRTE